MKVFLTAHHWASALQCICVFNCIYTITMTSFQAWLNAMSSLSSPIIIGGGSSSRSSRAKASSSDLKIPLSRASCFQLGPANFLISSPLLIFCFPRLRFPFLDTLSATLIAYWYCGLRIYIAWQAQFLSPNVNENIGNPHLPADPHRYLPIS